MGLGEAAGLFRSLFRAIDFKGQRADRLAMLAGAIALANRPKLPRIILKAHPDE